MAFVFRKKYIIMVSALAMAVFGYSFMFTSPAVDFNTEVKPLINRKCISCHGGVKQKGGYSLLFRQEALDTGASGRHGIIPGDPDNSELIRRLGLKDPDERMPYHETPLTEDEVDLLRRWIRQGARWGDHWAYVPVKEQVVPVPPRRFLGLLPGREDPWVRNDIDRFILEKQKEQGLSPAREADKRTLLRRLSLDLTGIPADRSLSERFLSDKSPDAYEKLVDSLLNRPQYGERWTALWLDLARYADTKGYERDGNRSIWRYRDWLIKAFNRDMPYDKFLIEQLAGDLLPAATDEQFIATAFHRNTMTNDEGGTDNEEFRTAAVLDRVNTTWETLMGTTFACVQCHSHPYDPFRHEEYYKFMAFFNDTRDEDTYAEYPLLHQFKGSDSLRSDSLNKWLNTNASREDAARIGMFLRTRQPVIHSLTSDSFSNSELADTKWLVMRKNSSARFRNVDLTGRNKLLFRYQARPADGRLSIRIDSINGREIARSNPAHVEKGWEHTEIPVEATEGVHDIHLVYTCPSLNDPNTNGIMFDWFHFTKEFPGRDKPGHGNAYAQYRQLLNSKEVVVTPVMVENPADMHRKTHVFVKGNRLVTGNEVLPDVPAALNPMPEGAPRNRYGLALWLTNTQNPLTARTMVNRLWEQIYGQGLAETIEDLGTQGITPTHQALLDHLSWKFMHEYSWSVKRLLKEMVMSATYRQDSRTDSLSLEKDRFNRWLARGPRLRLSAEQVRDQALAVSGLLSGKMYGPAVMPMQPDGIWQSPYNGEKWTKSTGEDQHRRAIYTFWKRTSPYPSFISFDAAAREVCLSRRIRTNTPLQALTTLNDPVYLEAAQRLAFALFREYGSDPVRIVQEAYLRATGRPIDGKRQAVLIRLYEETLMRMRKDPEKTCEMTGLQDANNKPETAAMVVVNNAILNLDEVLTKN